MNTMANILFYPIAFFLVIALIQINQLQKDVRKLDKDLFQEKLDRIKEKK